MNALLSAALVFAQGSGPRNDNQDEGLGIGIILGIVALVILALVGIWLALGALDRRRRANIGQVDEEETHPPGQVGRL